MFVFTKNSELRTKTQRDATNEHNQRNLSRNNATAWILSLTKISTEMQAERTPRWKSRDLNKINLTTGCGYFPQNLPRFTLLIVIPLLTILFLHVFIDLFITSNHNTTLVLVSHQTLSETYSKTQSGTSLIHLVITPLKFNNLRHYRRKHVYLY